MPTNPPAVLLTEAQLEEIRERVAKAAPGPWEWSRTYEMASHDVRIAKHWMIAHAPDDLGRLLGHIQALTAQLDALTETVEMMGQRITHTNDLLAIERERGSALTASIRTICEDHAEYETRAELARRTLAVIEGA